MNRKASHVALDLIRRSEVLRLKSYLDPVGRWTIGYGHTQGVDRGQVIDEEQAECFLLADVGEAIRTIYVYVPRGIIEALPQACFDALVSFVFNVGGQAFRRPDGRETDFYRAITGHDLVEVARQMQRWVKGRVDGQLRVLPGLVARRGQEAALWGAGLRQADSRHGASDRAVDQLVGDSTAQVVPPNPKPINEHPGAPVAAAAGAGGVAVVATTLTAAGQSVAASGDHIALVLGILLILVGAGVLLWIAKR